MKTFLVLDIKYASGQIAYVRAIKSSWTTGHLHDFISHFLFSLPLIMQLLWSRDDPFALLALGGEIHTLDPRFWSQAPSENDGEEEDGEASQRGRQGGGEAKRPRSGAKLESTISGDEAPTTSASNGEMTGPQTEDGEGRNGGGSWVRMKR